MPALLLLLGDAVSSSLTAVGVSLEFSSQSQATSSSVGPILLFSEGARKLLKIVAGSFGGPLRT